VTIVLTDNGTHFTTPGAGGSAAPLIAEAIAKGEPFWAHAFEYACATLGIEHRTTKPKHPWTNGQVERIPLTVCRQTVAGQRNRTIKDATVKRFHYDDHGQLERHLADFISAYNFGRRLKTLKGLTPYEFICKCWTSEPERFILNPLHQMPGLNKVFDPTI
jgi:transposase InsO family protein